MLHALRDRLTPEEAAHLSAQLPMLVRGLFFEGWRPADVPRRIRNKREFFALAASYFPDTGDPADPEIMTRAVLRTLARNVTTGEIKGRSRTVAGRSGGDAHSPGTGSWTDLDSRLVSILAASRDEKHENLSEAHIHYHDHSDRSTDCRNG